VSDSEKEKKEKKKRRKKEKKKNKSYTYSWQDLIKIFMSNIKLKFTAFIYYFK